jgi:nucleoside-diphosphate-sugar epimerase
MNLLAADLAYINKNLSRVLTPFRRVNIFLTGGTGFIGKWLLESFISVNRQFDLDSSITVLTRDYNRFKNSYPLLANSSELRFVEGDVRDFNYPEGKFDYLIHAATEADALVNVSDPLRMSDVICIGTKRILDFAKEIGIKRILFISSGAVYGIQPDYLMNISEDYLGGPDQLKEDSSYSESKRMAEFLCSAYARKFGIHVSIARCFAFIGPYLNLDIHFAAGNFIKNALNNEDIIIHGDGKPLRSYMYASDLAIWLWTILLNGRNGEAYNVGSGKAISIYELAKTVVQVVPGIKIKVLNQSRPTDRNFNYVPSVSKAISEFGLSENISIEDAVYRTIEFNKTTR